MNRTLKIAMLATAALLVGAGAVAATQGRSTATPGAAAASSSAMACDNPHGWTCCGSALVEVNCTPCDAECDAWCDVHVASWCCDVTRDNCDIIGQEERSLATDAAASSAMCSNPHGWTCCGSALVQVNCTPCDAQCDRWCDVYVASWCCDVTRDQCKVIGADERAVAVDRAPLQVAPRAPVSVGLPA